MHGKPDAVASGDCRDLCLPSAVSCASQYNSYTNRCISCNDRYHCYCTARKYYSSSRAECNQPCCWDRRCVANLNAMQLKRSQCSTTSMCLYLSAYRGLGNQSRSQITSYCLETVSIDLKMSQLYHRLLRDQLCHAGQPQPVSTLIATPAVSVAEPGQPTVTVTPSPPDASNSQAPPRPDAASQGTGQSQSPPVGDAASPSAVQSPRSPADAAAASTGPAGSTAAMPPIPAVGDILSAFGVSPASLGAGGSPSPSNIAAAAPMSSPGGTVDSTYSACCVSITCSIPE